MTTHCPSVGIIPAYAGSTVKPTTRPWCRAGSSPHTRGALCRLLRDGRYPRIIPAYAGSTSVAHSGRASDSDHPRIRGEHRRRAGRGIVPFGSSPHTRGARRFGRCAAWRERIIPAYAGSTERRRIDRRKGRDHPRIRGEHFEMDDTRFGCRGSSPHTRGAHRHQSSEHAQSGIIPAYAGSTFSPTRRRSRMADHPRIRGEHRRAVGDAYGTEGSSPHTRGALVAPDRCDGRGRIIPAYAGSTNMGNQAHGSA